MKLKLALIFTIGTTCFSCEKQSQSPSPDILNLSGCGVNNPVKELKWLSDEVKTLTGGEKLSGVVLFQYQNKELIEIQCSVFSSTNLHQYNCDGTKLDFSSSDQAYKNFKEYLQNRKEIKVLWGTKMW